MRRALHMLSLGAICGSALLWAGTGAHRGWTRTSEPVKVVDDVTGIEGVAYRKKFVAGVDILGGGLLAGACLAGASLLFRNRSVSPNNNSKQP